MQLHLRTKITNFLDKFVIKGHQKNKSSFLCIHLVWKCFTFLFARCALLLSPGVRQFVLFRYSGETQRK